MSAIGDANTVHCWHWGPQGELLNPEPMGVPGGEYRNLSGGSTTFCAINPEQGLECWGREDLAAPPAGSYIDVDVGTGRACAVDEAGAVTCWGLY